MAGTLHVDVVSAEQVVVSMEAVHVTARTPEGDIGIRAGHAPVFSVLVPSAVEIVDEPGGREVVVIGGGFLSVSDNRVSILAEEVTRAEHVDAAAVEAELEAARRELESSTGAEAEAARVRIQHAQGQLRAAHIVTADH